MLTTGYRHTCSEVEYTRSIQVQKLCPTWLTDDITSLLHCEVFGNWSTNLFSRCVEWSGSIPTLVPSVHWHQLYKLESFTRFKQAECAIFRPQMMASQRDEGGISEWGPHFVQRGPRCWLLPSSHSPLWAVYWNIIIGGQLWPIQWMHGQLKTDRGVKGRP